MNVISRKKCQMCAGKSGVQEYLFNQIAHYDMRVVQQNISVGGSINTCTIKILLDVLAFIRSITFPRDGGGHLLEATTKSRSH